MHWRRPSDSSLTERRPPMSQDPRVSIHTCPALVIWRHQHLFLPLTQTSSLTTTRKKNHLSKITAAIYHDILPMDIMVSLSHLPSRITPIPSFYACIWVGLMLGISVWFQVSCNLSWYVLIDFKNIPQTIANIVFLTCSLSIFQSTPFFQEMDLCLQTTSHYLNQWWPSSLKFTLIINGK